MQIADGPKIEELNVCMKLHNNVPQQWYEIFTFDGRSTNLDQNSSIAGTHGKPRVCLFFLMYVQYGPIHCGNLSVLEARGTKQQNLCPNEQD